jgi:3-phenylpropionate/trans-cinnamate dioxygenase ferredoxin component
VTFVVVANIDDLEVGDTMLVDELREPICLIRLDNDDVRAIHNTCTHQQQPLHEGTLQDDDTLVCAAHASRYDLTTGEAVGVFACGPIPVYACKIEDDAILVDIDQQLNDAPIPGPPAPGTLGARLRWQARNAAAAGGRGPVHDGEAAPWVRQADVDSLLASVEHALADLAR